MTILKVADKTTTNIQENLCPSSLGFPILAAFCAQSFLREVRQFYNQRTESP